MRRRIFIWGGMVFMIAITTSCSFFKKLVNSDLETEEDFIIEEVSKDVPRQTPKPTVKPQNKKNKMNVTLCDKDNVQLYDAIEKWYGTPYKMGGCSLTGIDCSCFTLTIYETVYGIKLNRRAMDMVKDIQLIDRKELREGDLVFFKNNGKINHVGIYLKEDMFVHASSSKGVMISKLTENYWNSRFYKGGRHKNVRTKWK